MKIHILSNRATPDQMRDMAEELSSYIKLAVDIKRGILAGGGEYHADCEAVLLDDGSVQEDVWGADWYPDSRTVGFGALINISPRRGNRGMEIEDLVVRTTVESIVRRLMEETP